MITEKEIRTIISDIQASPKECEWVEIKENNANPEVVRHPRKCGRQGICLILNYYK